MFETTSAAHYRNFYENAPVGQLILSGSGMVLYANAQAALLLGVAAGDLPGCSIFDQVGAEDLLLLKSRMSRLCSTNEPHTLELRIRKAAGAVFWARLDLFRLPVDSTGCTVGAIMVDISDRVHMELFAGLSSEILGILNSPGNFSEAIRGILLRLKEFTRADAVGIRLQQGDDFPYIHHDGFGGDFLLKENSLVAHDPEGGVCRNPDGSICLECTCGLVLSGKTDPSHPLFTSGGSCWTNNTFPLLDLPESEDPRFHPRNNCIHEGFGSVALVPIKAQGRIIGIMQFNGYEKSLFCKSEIIALEGIAAHVGEVLLLKQKEDELHCGKLQLESANEDLDAFAGSVAHDLQNSIVVIQGFADLLSTQDGVATDAICSEYLSRILELTKSVSAQIRALLTYARLSKTALVRKQIDVNGVIARVIDELAQLHPDMDIAFTIQPGMTALSDEALFFHIMQNLIGNAWKFTLFCEHPAVAIGTEEIEGELTFFVHDNGAGFDMALAGKLFRPFERLHSKSQFAGSGFGLYAIRRIIEKHGGRIWAESQPQRGATFFFTLPEASGN